MKIKTFAGLVILLCVVSACHKNISSSGDSPSLSFAKAHLLYKPSPIDSTTMVAYCVVTLDFEDAQGDIGYSDSERETLFPTAPEIPALSYPFADTTTMYPLLLDYYNGLQEEYYTSYYPDESYIPFNDSCTYQSLMRRYYTLTALYERIMMDYYYSLIVEYYEGDNPPKVRKDVNYSSVLPPLGGYVPSGSVARGQIVYDMNISSRQNDTLSFTFVLRDRAGNESDEVRTPLFIVR